MGHVTESIYSSPSITVPLADVRHIEKSNPLGLIVVNATASDTLADITPDDEDRGRIHPDSRFGVGA